MCVDVCTGVLPRSVNHPGLCKHGCTLVYAVYARVRALRYLGFRELCAGRSAARRLGLGGGRARVRQRPAFRVRRCLPGRCAAPHGDRCLPPACVRLSKACRGGVSQGRERRPPSLPSPLARSQTQIKHFLPLSSYPAGQAARALPLPAPSLPLAVSQSLCSLRRPGGM